MRELEINIAHGRENKQFYLCGTNIRINNLIVTKMNKKISLEDLPNLVVDLSMKVDKLLEEISKININEEATPVWLDLGGLCEYLPQKPARQTVYEWCSQRKIPFHKVGGDHGKYTIFLRSEIDEWLLSSSIKNESTIEEEAFRYIKNENKRNYK